MCPWTSKGRPLFDEGKLILSDSLEKRRKGYRITARQYFFWLSFLAGGIIVLTKNQDQKYTIKI